ARDSAAPALAIAFIAVAVGLGGFALAYRATLVRGSSDQAANQVPLDALVAPTPGFTTPLELAPLARWTALARGSVLPVRRTYASFVSGEPASRCPRSACRRPGSRICTAGAPATAPRRCP